MIYVFCPDENSPIGGIKVLYRHVDILNGLGIPAAIVHEREGFRCTWFENSTIVLSKQTHQPEPGSFVVLPEIHGPDAASIAPGLPKVIFNQNASLTFRGYPFEGPAGPTPYLNPEVLATLVISEHVGRYVHHAFPSMPIMRVRWSIDGGVFGYSAAKRRQICFMPRKNPDEARQVLNILRHRGALDGFTVVPIDKMNEQEVAQVMKESMLFFSFGYPEGLPLPPAEAMVCGCAVVGYHGFGGEEYFKEDICLPVPVADVLEFASVAERVMQQAVAAPEEILAMGSRASEYITTEFSEAREVEEIRQAWAKIFALRETGARDK